MTKQYYTLEVPEIKGCHPATVREKPIPLREQDFCPLQVLNCRYEEDGSEVSFSVISNEFSAVVINSQVPADKCHCVAGRIIDLCIESKVEKLILLGCVRLDLPNSEVKDMYENLFNTKPITNCSALPEDTKIADPMLCTLIQMLNIEEFPCNCLLIPGHKASYGRANSDDGSKQAIKKFQEILMKLTRLQFDHKLSCSLMYKGKNQEDIDSVSMMYL
ncbi:hypothetical protein ScPMuIL_008729 [Solemya velum]